MSGEKCETVTFTWNYGLARYDKCVKTIKLIPPNQNDSEPFWRLQELENDIVTTIYGRIADTDVKKCENAMKKVSKSHPEFFGPDKAVGGNLKISLMFVYQAALSRNHSNLNEKNRMEEADKYYVQGQHLARLIRFEMNENPENEEKVEGTDPKVSKVLFF